MGETGHETVTAEALGPMLDRMKNEIVQDLAAKLTAEITRQIVGILDTKIESAVEPIRRDLTDQTERNARHSNQLREVAAQIAGQIDQNTKVMELFTKNGEQINHMVKSMDAMIQTTQNMQRMIDFQMGEIEQNRKIADDTNEWVQRHSEEGVKFRSQIHQSVNVISQSIVETGKKIGQLDEGQRKLEAGQRKTEDQLEEATEFLRRVNIVASLFDKRRNQAAFGVATVMLTQGDTLIQWAGDLSRSNVALNHDLLGIVAIVGAVAASFLLRGRKNKPGNKRKDRE